MKKFDKIDKVLDLLTTSYIHELMNLGDDSEYECNSIKQLAVLLEKVGTEAETVSEKIENAKKAFLTTGYSCKEPTQYELGRLLNCIMILSAEVTESNYKEFVESVRAMIEVIQLWNPGYELENYTKPYDEG